VLVPVLVVGGVAVSFVQVVAVVPVRYEGVPTVRTVRVVVPLVRGVASARVGA